MNQLPDNYIGILSKLKERIRAARIKAAQAVNKELLFLYWELGQAILEMQQSEGWGSKVIDRISADLKADFPDFKGLSTRNLKYMASFARLFPEFGQQSAAQIDNTDYQQDTIVQATLAQLSWYHILTLMDKVKEDDVRRFYIEQTVKNGWSRDVMVHQIESNLHKRLGQLPNNFENTLAPEDSELVKQAFKDPYKLEFILVEEVARERDLENAIINQLTKFLLELGQHFAFMGRQYKMVLGEKEYFYDLLFYHTRLKRYIVIELKIDDFKPEYKGKMEFYLNLADDQLKQEGDGKSIGLILCKTKDGLVAEYALRESTMPIGIAEYTLGHKLPEDIKGELPTIAELEAEIEREYEELKKPGEKKLDAIKARLKGLNRPPVKEKRNSENSERILGQVVLPLRDEIKKLLEAIEDQFESTEIVLWTGHQGHYKDDDAYNWLATNKETDEFRINIRLNGCKPAGTKAFDVWGETKVMTQNYSYKIAVTNYLGSEQPMEKLYHELPTKEELEEIAEQFIDVITEQISQQLDRLEKGL